MRAVQIEKRWGDVRKNLSLGFNMIRSNDLIWSYVVNNYLKGKNTATLRPALLEFGPDEPSSNYVQHLRERDVCKE